MTVTRVAADASGQALPAPTSTPTSTPAITPRRIKRGVCFVVFAYDVGTGIDLNEAERLAAGETQRKPIEQRRRTPRYFQFEPPPLLITRPTQPIEINGLSTHAAIDLMLYDFGAITVTFTLPISGPLAGLLTVGDRLYDNSMLLERSRAVVRQLAATIAPAVGNLRISDVVEDYVIYHLAELTEPIAPADLVRAYGPLLAQILRAEGGALSDQEIEDALACRIAYGDKDLAVIDWNAAILLDPDPADVRAVLEFANVELLEMRQLDGHLDAALSEAYEVLTRRKRRRTWANRARTRDLKRVAQLQVDSALLFEGVNNAIKLLGDQYLARLYRVASQRLHLPDWDASILRKLESLESIYQKISNEQANWRMEVLEWIIILLILISIVLPFFVTSGGH
jgi:hypothetical protein